MNKNIILSVIATIIISGGLGFYVGDKYRLNKTSISVRNGEMFANLSSEERAGRFQQSGAGQRGTMAGSNFTSGEIITKDAESVTLKLRDGGSKIIFFSAGTSLSKTTSGAPDELIVGKQISAEGALNQDGSLSAKSIQIQ